MTDTNDIAIRTDGLTKRYGTVTALEDLNLAVREGEVFGFLGPNGAGKTTTIDVLLDFIRPTEGTATVLGHDVQADPDAVRERVGVLPDGFDLWNRSSGYRQLEFAIASNGNGEAPEALLDRVGLDPEAARRPVGGYSKGMKQRLAMAMALVGDPDLLILDEPSSGLDPHGIRTMQRLVREAAATGTTVFFSSHILGQVAAVCDRVGILDEGRLVTVDTIDGLREQTGIGSQLTLRVADDPGVELVDIDGVADVADGDDGLTVTYTDPAAKAAVVHRLVDAGVRVRDFETREPTLDDLFAAYTNGEADDEAVGTPAADTDGEVRTSSNDRTAAGRPASDGPETIQDDASAGVGR